MSQRKRIIHTILAAFIALLVCLPVSAAVNVHAASTPGTVKLTKISSPDYNDIKIEWKKTSGATHYVVYYKEAGKSGWKKLKRVSASKSSYTHTSSSQYPIKVGKKYSYTVKAYNSATNKYGKYNTKGLTTRTAPRNVKLKLADYNSKTKSVKISWEKSRGMTHYVIFTKTNPSAGWKRIAAVSSSATSYTDKSPAKGCTNYYTVRAYNRSGDVWGRKYNKTGVKVNVPGATSGNWEQTALNLIQGTWYESRNALNKEKAIISGKTITYYYYGTSAYIRTETIQKIHKTTYGYYFQTGSYSGYALKLNHDRNMLWYQSRAYTDSYSGGSSLVRNP